jgi:hypothetical protein
MSKKPKLTVYEENEKMIKDEGLEYFKQRIQTRWDRECAVKDQCIYYYYLKKKMSKNNNP